MASQILPISNLYAASAQSLDGFQQRRSEFRQLTQSLASGDLAGAQQAFSSLTSNQSQSSQSNSPLSQDWSALGQALQNGDLSGAQQAFAKVQQDFKTQAQGAQAAQGTQGAHHGHHHHHASADSDGDSSTTQATNGLASSGTTSSPTGSVNLVG